MRWASGTAESDGDLRETNGLAGSLIAADAPAALGLVAPGGAVSGAFSSVARAACDARLVARSGNFLRLPESLPKVLWGTLATEMHRNSQWRIRKRCRRRRPGR